MLLSTLFEAEAPVSVLRYIYGPTKFIRTHKRFSPENIMKLRRIMPQLSFMSLTRDTWIPFVRSLEQCIENQTLIDDIRPRHGTD